MAQNALGDTRFPLSAMGRGAPALIPFLDAMPLSKHLSVPLMRHARAYISVDVCEFTPGAGPKCHICTVTIINNRLK